MPPKGHSHAAIRLTHKQPMSVSRWHDALVDASGSNFGPLWARSMDWELDNPAAGDVLAGEGIRIFGSVETPPNPVEGIHPGEIDLGGAGPTATYVVTGSVVSARDYQVDLGSGPRHAGAHVVLSVTGDLIQAQVPAAAATDLQRDAQLTVRGEISLVADYEWDAFELVDTRRSWSVEEVQHLGSGDYLLLLRPAR
jgi:hypothetical protein